MNGMHEEKRIVNILSIYINKNDINTRTNAEKSMKLCESMWKSSQILYIFVFA